MHNFIRIFRGAESTDDRRMISSSRVFSLVAAATFVVTAATCRAEQPAEQPAQPTAQQTQPISSPRSTLDLRAYLNAPLNTTATEDSGTSSSVADAASSDEDATT